MLCYAMLTDWLTPPFFVNYSFPRSPPRLRSILSSNLEKYISKSRQIQVTLWNGSEMSFSPLSDLVYSDPSGNTALIHRTSYPIISSITLLLLPASVVSYQDWHFSKPTPTIISSIATARCFKCLHSVYCIVTLKTVTSTVHSVWCIHCIYSFVFVYFCISVFVQWVGYE